MKEEKYISVADLAAAMGCSTTAVYNALISGKVRGEQIKIGFSEKIRWRIPASELDRFAGRLQATRL